MPSKHCKTSSFSQKKTVHIDQSYLPYKLGDNSNISNFHPRKLGNSNIVQICTRRYSHVHQYFWDGLVQPPTTKHRWPRCARAYAKSNQTEDDSSSLGSWGAQRLPNVWESWTKPWCGMFRSLLPSTTYYCHSSLRVFVCLHRWVKSSGRCRYNRERHWVCKDFRRGKPIQRMY